MRVMNEYLAILGKKVSDRVTGFQGVATSVSFDLYGCVQVVVSPEKDIAGKIPGADWFDHKRLFTISETPVMDVPTFANVPGGATLPLPKQNPLR